LTVGRDEHHADAGNGAIREKAVNEIQAIAIRQLNVDEKEIRREPRQKTAGRGRVFSHRYVVTRFRQVSLKHLPHVYVVIDDQDVRATSAGILDGTVSVVRDGYPRRQAYLRKRSVDEIAQFPQAVFEDGARGAHHADVADL
jgi:hypothetical protein